MGAGKTTKGGELLRLLSQNLRNINSVALYLAVILVEYERLAISITSVSATVRPIIFAGDSAETFYFTATIFFY